jgi:hypothetical protein
MKRKRWFETFFGIPTLAAFVGLGVLTISYGYISALNMSFNGVVQRIEYRFPGNSKHFTVNGKSYEYWDIQPSNTKDTLAVGDSVIKEKGSTGFILIKAKKPK